MSSPLVLVTGGAGYLGSHVVSALTSAGYNALVLDNLSVGNADLVLPHAWALVEGAYGDLPLVRALLERSHPANPGRPVAAVVHCASDAPCGDDGELLTVLNVGSGAEISIRDLANAVARECDFRGTISWDASKPDGTPRKLLDSSRLAGLGWRARILLEQGRASTVTAYRQECEGQLARLG
ncbi:NAD-dependent epimerase/dehydratase family protein [Synechococcus sp. CB0205]|uniref:NAD-dependent epimerase/dehydratase family protein n=1 Tax=Synechococcus sp. CB0205 TaxID=232363 RepID=UPI0009FC766C|nr:NAD-dependent epimerase/dehydratase family protein [Synechococcus sp. CB0205]